MSLSNAESIMQLKFYHVLIYLIEHRYRRLMQILKWLQCFLFKQSLECDSRETYFWNAWNLLGISQDFRLWNILTEIPSTLT